MAVDAQVSDGRLFSRVYMERGEPTQDSAKLRQRFGYFVEKMVHDDVGKYAVAMLSIEVGTKPNQRAIHVYDWPGFFARLSVADMLDSITVVIAAARSLGFVADADNMRDFVDRALREENLGYRIGSLGGVHFYVDEEFERSRVATLDVLGSNGNEAARQAVDEAHRALRSGDTLMAVRRAFDAVENRFKIDHSCPRLGAAEIKSKLTNVVAGRYEGRSVDAANRMLASFAEWANAAHQFRHAPGTPDPSAPPVDLAILMVSEAMGFVRWLALLKAASAGQ